jgi:hypothetical protein
MEEIIMIRLFHSIYSDKKLILTLFLLSFLILSCGTRKLLKPSCTLPSGVDLEEALTHSRKDLGHFECETLFDNYYQRLIEVAKRDPDIENKRRFSEFLEWSHDQGIIDKIQARSYYNRYFNTTFISLPDDYNVCSSCIEDTQKDIENQMENELRQKEEGLLKACRDKNAYYAASDQYNSILLLLDATCRSCRH